jgi:hypothetical protein
MIKFTKNKPSQFTLFALWSCLDQQFSTWGTHTPGGTQAVNGGVHKILQYIKISPQKVNKIVVGGTQKGSILIWGYAKGLNIELGVRE